MPEPILNENENTTSQPTVLTADQKIAQLEAETLKALQGESGENQSTEEGQVSEQEAAPAEEGTAEETQETKTPGEGDGETEESQTTPDNEDEEVDLSQFKAKGQDRIRELAEKAKKVPELERQITRLQAMLGLGKQTIDKTQEPSSVKGQTPQKQEPAYQLPWAQKPAQDATQTQELSEEELSQRIQNESQRQIRNQRILDTLNYDIADVQDRYAELRTPTDDNPNPQFDQKLVTNLAKWYQTLFEKDNSLRFGDFVDEIMSLKVKGAEEGKRQKVKILETQAAEQAVDPSGTPTASGEKSLEQKIRSAKSSADLAAIEALLPHAD